MRDFTPRGCDAKEGWIEIDFALHEAGPVTIWALGARPGDPAVIAGPRGSMVVKRPIAHWVLVGDETALPSIGRRIEELAAGQAVTSLIAAQGPQDEQVLATTANHRAIWVHRKDPTDATGLLAALRSLELGPHTYVWIAAEASVARAAEAAALDMGLPPEWLRAAGYWLAGEADTAVKDL